MPSPSFPTGSVSGGSDGTRTFPVRDAPRLERVRESSVNGPADDARPASVHEELAQLRRENERLRRALHETRQQRQDVIDRYERLLDGTEPASESAFGSAADAEAESAPRTSASSSSPSRSRSNSFADRVVAALDARWTTLRGRYRRWVGESGL